MNYEKHYDLLINRSKSRARPEGYIEKHHIIPKCLGGSDEPENLVELTAREHYIAHQLLVKMNPKIYAITYAAVMMTRTTGQTVRSNRMYSWLRTRFSEEMSIAAKIRFSDKSKHPCFGKFGKDHPRFGHAHSDEHKRKMSVTMKGRTLSSEAKSKLSNSIKLSSNRAEFKSKISLIRKVAFKGEKNPAYGTKMINNGIVRKRIARNLDIPDGWFLGAKLYKPETEF
jgi:hypothetical protein